MFNNRITRLSMFLLLPLLFVACGGDTDSKSDSEISDARAKAETDPKGTTERPAGELCLAHGAAADKCFICDAASREPGRLWCREHARYEDRCFVCHPELRDKNRLYCEEHGLYEDECFLCHPELKLEESSAKSQAADVSLA